MATPTRRETSSKLGLSPPKKDRVGRCHPIRPVKEGRVKKDKVRGTERRKTGRRQGARLSRGYKAAVSAWRPGGFDSDLQKL